MNAVTEQPNDAEIESLKLEQKKLSRRIGQAKKKGENARPLLEKIQGVSAKIKALESAKKNKKTDDNVQASVGAAPSVEMDFALYPIRENAGDEIDVAQVVVEPLNALDRDFPVIEKYLADHPGSTPYHRPCILRAIQESFGHDVCYLVAKNKVLKEVAGAAESVVGVLPVVQLRSKLFGNYCVSMPFFNYGGVLADSQSVANKLLAASKDWATKRGAQHVEYRYSAQPPFNLPQKSDKVSFYLALPESVEALRQSFKSKLRSQIKKAESYPHQVRQGGEPLVEDFYRVFSENMRDLGTPVYSKDFFRNLCCVLGERLNICVVYYDEQPAAAAIVIGHKDRLEIPWASTLRRYNPKSVNMLLYWRVLSWAVEKGYTCFDFGRCSPDAGTYKFKAQWGATELPLYWDYHLMGAEMPALNTKNKKFLILIALWQKLPVWVANLVGPHVVKYLP